MSENLNSPSVAPDSSEGGVNPLVIPSSVLEEIGHKYGKHQMLLLGHDAELGTIQVITWGVTKEANLAAERGGQLLQAYLEEHMFRQTATPEQLADHENRLNQPQDNYDEEGMVDINGVSLQLGDAIRLRYQKQERQAVLAFVPIEPNMELTTEKPLSYYLRQDLIAAKFTDGRNGNAYLALNNFQDAVKSHSIRKADEHA